MVRLQLNTWLFQRMQDLSKKRLEALPLLYRDPMYKQIVLEKLVDFEALDEILAGNGIGQIDFVHKENKQAVAVDVPGKVAEFFLEGREATAVGPVDQEDHDLDARYVVLPHPAAAAAHVEDHSLPVVELHLADVEANGRDRRVRLLRVGQQVQEARLARVFQTN